MSEKALLSEGPEMQGLVLLCRVPAVRGLGARDTLTMLPGIFGSSGGVRSRDFSAA